VGRHLFAAASRPRRFFGRRGAAPAVAALDGLRRGPAAAFSPLLWTPSTSVGLQRSALAEERLACSSRKLLVQFSGRMNWHRARALPLLQGCWGLPRPVESLALLLECAHGGSMATLNSEVTAIYQGWRSSVMVDRTLHVHHHKISHKFCFAQILCEIAKICKICANLLQIAKFAQHLHTKCEFGFNFGIRTI